MPISYLARFVDQFFKGFGGTLKGWIVDGTLLLAALIWSWHTGRLSVHTLRSNAWESGAPWLLVLCLVAIWHGFKAAYELSTKIDQEVAGQMPSSSPILRPDGTPAYVLTPPRRMLLHRLKGYGIACFILIVFGVAACVIWITDSQKKAPNSDAAINATLSSGPSPLKQSVPANKEQPKQKPKSKGQPHESVPSSKSQGSEEDGREKIDFADNIKAKVIRHPAVSVSVNRQRTIRIVDEIGAPLKGAQIMLVRVDGTHSDLAVSDSAGAADILAPDEVANV